MKRCASTEPFGDSSWCDDFFRVGERIRLDLHLREHDGRVDGFVILAPTGELEIDAGSSLDAEGRIQLTARGDPWGGWNGPLLAIIDPFTGQIRNGSVEGRFVMTIVAAPDSTESGSVVVEADLDPASFEK